MHLAIIDSFMKGVAQTTAPLTPLARQADVTGAQTPGAQAAALEFEEASVRPCDPDNLPPAAGWPWRRRPERGLHDAGAVLCAVHDAGHADPDGLWISVMEPGNRDVVYERYRAWWTHVLPLIGTGSVYNTGVEDGRRVRGGPDWMRTEAYTIEAVAGVCRRHKEACAPDSIGGRAGQLPNQPPRPGMPCRSANAASMSGPMLRALLERRFGLKAHIEEEQTPAYSLVVAPGGLKMKEGACTPDRTAQARARGPRNAPDKRAERARRLMDLVRRNLDAARRGDATTGLCGFGLADNGPNRIFVGAGAGLPPLKEHLEAPVTDRTGIPNTRRFNYALEFLVEQTRNPFERDSFPSAPDCRRSVERAAGAESVHRSSSSSSACGWSPNRCAARVHRHRRDQAARAELGDPGSGPGIRDRDRGSGRC